MKSENVGDKNLPTGHCPRTNTALFAPEIGPSDTTSNIMTLTMMMTMMMNMMMMMTMTMMTMTTMMMILIRQATLHHSRMQFLTNVANIEKCLATFPFIVAPHFCFFKIFNLSPTVVVMHNMPHTSILHTKAEILVGPFCIFVLICYEYFDIAEEMFEIRTNSFLDASFQNRKYSDNWFCIFCFTFQSLFWRVRVKTKD